MAIAFWKCIWSHQSFIGYFASFLNFFSRNWRKKCAVLIRTLNMQHKKSRIAKTQFLDFSIKTAGTLSYRRMKTASVYHRRPSRYEPFFPTIDKCMEVRFPDTECPVPFLRN